MKYYALINLITLCIAVPVSNSTINDTISASQAGPNTKPYPNKFTLLHTNDIHSHMEEFNNGGTSCSEANIATNACFGGVARIKTVVDAYRANTTEVILMDAGDQFQGTLFFNFYNGSVSTIAMNILKYDVMTIGNHEFDQGVVHLAEFIKTLDFPVISANIDTSSALTAPLKAAGVAPYTILEKYNLGVIGFITNTTADIIKDGDAFRSSILDPVTTVQKYVNELNSKGVKRIICLSHNGYHDDVYLAQNVRGVSLIVGGHSHSLLLKNLSVPQVQGPYPTQTLSNLDSKPVYIVQAHRYGDYLGHLDLEWNDNDELVSIVGDPILLDQTIPKEPTLNATVFSYEGAFETLTQDIVTTATADFPKACGPTDCAMGDLLTECMMSEQTGIDFAFINSGGIRASFGVGKVSSADIMNVLPFGSPIVNYKLNGTALSAQLERIAGEKQNGIISQPQISGIVLTYNVSLPLGSRVVSALLAGKAIEPTKMYQLSTIDFVTNGGDNIVIPKPSPAPIEGVGISDLFGACLRKKKSISPDLHGHIVRLQ